MSAPEFVRQGLSINEILDKVVALARRYVAVSRDAKALDVGAGAGRLIARLKEVLPGVETHACDYVGTLMEEPDQAVEIADLSRDPLPYAAETFDLVTCTEVVEHLENHCQLTREIFRVTKPGGTAIFSTPNILNLQSRLRFLWFGFWKLFGPLPVGRAESFSTVGHINPISYFYLAHALGEAGFTLEPLEIDKIQRSAIPRLVFLWPLIAGFGALALRREVNHYETVDPSNRAIVKSLNSLKMLLGRTIIVVARKPTKPTVGHSGNIKDNPQSSA